MKNSLIWFSGNIEILDNYINQYNQLAEKLEGIGADYEIFMILSKLCDLSIMIYP